MHREISVSQQLVVLGISSVVGVGIFYSGGGRVLEDWMISLGDRNQEWSEDIRRTGGVDVKVDQDGAWVLVSLRSSGRRWNTTRRVDILSEGLEGLKKEYRSVLGEDIEAIKVPFPYSEETVAVLLVRKK